MSAVTKKKPANTEWVADVPSDKVFYCHNGQVLKNLSDLAVTLRQMSSETYSHHANDHKNDFSSWVSDVVGDKTLANDLRRAHSHTAAANQVEARIAAIRAKKSGS